MMAAAPQVHSEVDVISIAGEYRIRKSGRRRDTSYGNFSRAEAAALRLLNANPGDTFIITQEVALVCRHALAVKP